MSTYDLETTIQLPDEDDVDVLIEFEVTSWGSPGCAPSLSYPGDPPEPPEWDITKIERLDNGVDITDMFNTLSEEQREQLEQCVFEKIYEIEESRGYDD